MNFTVKSAVKREREPVIKGSTFHAYLLELEGRDGKVEMLQKPETAVPKAGDVIDGEIQPGKEKDDGTKWPDKFKRIGQTQGGWKPRDPSETAAIVRQHSQAMALAYAALGDGPVVAIEQIKEWADWFDADVASIRAPQSPETASVQQERPAVPLIPEDRALKILEAAKAAKLAQQDENGVVLTPSFAAKLNDVGVETQKIGHLNVDQAEQIEAWIASENA